LRKKPARPRIEGPGQGEEKVSGLRSAWNEGGWKSEKGKASNDEESFEGEEKTIESTKKDENLAR